MVENALNQHYHQTAPWYDIGEDYGDPIATVIGEAAQIESRPAEDVRSVLESQHADIELEKSGESNPFESEARYKLKAPDDIVYQTEWSNFEKTLKTEARFFSRTAYATLQNVFGGLELKLTESGQPVIVVAGKGKALAELYRARVFQSEEKLIAALKRPDLEIGPPSSSQATAGRMNARGISVFYGARESETARAELRPPVGSSSQLVDSR